MIVQVFYKTSEPFTKLHDTYYNVKYIKESCERFYLVFDEYRTEQETIYFDCKEYDLQATY